MTTSTTRPTAAETTEAPTERSVSDVALRRAIDEEFSWTSLVDSARIDVAVRDGVVTLSGEARSQAEKLEAVRTACRVRGVRSIVDRIVMAEQWGPPLDADLASRARRALDASPLVPPGAVTPGVHRHVITLSGQVSSDYQREAAERTVSRLPAVRWVVNRITVRRARA